MELVVKEDGIDEHQLMEAREFVNGILKNFDLKRKMIFTTDTFNKKLLEELEKLINNNQELRRKLDKL